MTIKRLGMVGWRGMVGQVLMDRMLTENDFANLEVHFFSTSQSGQANPYAQKVKGSAPALADANDIAALSKMDVLITAQGGDYTKAIHPSLRKSGWKGFWIDAASSLRMNSEALIILDPLNRQQIENGIRDGIRDFAGGNCTVSLMMMAIGGLLQSGHVEWITSMTYQAASGAGSRHMTELLEQSQFLTSPLFAKSQDSASLAERILEVEKSLKVNTHSTEFPKKQFGYPLAFNLLPWIDSELENGQSREEWKGSAELNKILGLKEFLPVDGTCVRVSALRCHSQGLTIKLKKDIPLNDIEGLIREHNPWSEWVANNKAETLSKLTPAYTSGTLKVPVGRVRKMNLGPQYINAFTVGDQLLWGAAEPLRRMLRILTGAL